MNTVQPGTLSNTASTEEVEPSSSRRPRTSFLSVPQYISRASFAEPGLSAHSRYMVSQEVFHLSVAKVAQDGSGVIATPVLPATSALGDPVLL